MKDILCRFCNKKQGELQDIVDVIDSRCDDCTILHGIFQEMEQKCTQDLGMTYDEFKEIMVKCEYKKSLFKKEYSKLKTEKMEGFKDLTKSEQNEIITNLEKF